MIDLQNIILPYIDLSNLTDFFLIVLISILFSVAMYVIMHFLSVTISKKIFSFKNIGYIKQVIIYQLIGLILTAGIIPLFYYVNDIINANLYLVSMQVIVFLVVGIFVSHWIIVGMVPSFLVANILYLIKHKNDQFISSLIYMIAFFVLSYIFALISNIFLRRSELKKSKSNKSYWLFIVLPIISLFLFLLMRFLGIYIFDEQNLLWTIFFVNILINWLLFLMLVAIGSLVKKILDNTFTLKESIMYDNEIFVNNGYSKTAFDNYVRNNKVRMGLFITFEFKLTNDIYTENRDVLKLLIENLKNFLKNNFNDIGIKNNINLKKNKKNNNLKHLFFFKTKWNEYGLFYEINKEDLNLEKSYQNNYEIDRDKKDLFYLLSEKIKSFSSVPIIFKEKEYYFETSCFVSIYGMHSNNFEKLVEYNQKLKSHWMSKQYKNNIKILNFKDIDDSINKVDFKKIKESYKLEKGYISLNSIKSKKTNSNKSKFLLVPGIIWVDKQIYSFEDIYNKITSLDDLTLILRNFAYRTLKLSEKLINENIEKYNKYSIVINYPIFELAKKSFSIKNLITKIENTNLNKSKLIFNFDFQKLDTVDDLELFIKNLKRLKKELNISFSNVDYQFNSTKKNYDILSPNKIKFIPNYVFIKENNKENKFIKSKFRNSSIYPIY